MAGGRNLAAGLVAALSLGAVPAMATTPGTPGVIAYEQHFGGGLHLLATDGGIAGPVALGLPAGWGTSTRDLRFSPDGTTLAFSTRDIEADASVVAVAPATGGPSRELLRSTRGLGKLGWSPDGRWIAVSRFSWGDETADLVLVAADGSRTVTVLDDDALSIGGAISWSPECTAIAFAGERVGEHIVVDGHDEAVIDIHRLELPSRRLTRLTSGSLRPQSLDYRPDGRTLLTTQRVEGRDPSNPNLSWHINRIVTLPAAGGPTTPVFDPSPGTLPAPTWSPDGQRILHGQDGALWTMTTAGGDRRQLTPGLTAEASLGFDWQSLPAHPPPPCDPLGEEPAPAAPTPPPGFGPAPLASPGPAAQSSPPPAAQARIRSLHASLSRSHGRTRLRLTVQTTGAGRLRARVQRRTAEGWRSLPGTTSRRLKRGRTTVDLTARLGRRPWRAGRHRVRVTFGGASRVTSTFTVPRR